MQTPYTFFKKKSEARQTDILKWHFCGLLPKCKNRPLVCPLKNMGYQMNQTIGYFTQTEPCPKLKGPAFSCTVKLHRALPY